MRFIFYSPVCFEKWDYRNSVEKGIGGSETSHVEMAWRLAKKGHEVITYAPIPDDCVSPWKGTVWKKLEEVDWTQKGFWMLYRCPEALDNFPTDHPDQKLYLMLQDWDYPSWSPERLEKLDKMIPLCKSHANYLLDRHPEFKGKIWITSNGVKVDDIEDAEDHHMQDTPKRNPLKIIYASSPDRGLKNLLKIFAKAREFVPELELHAFYGFNNLNKLIDMNPKSSFRNARSEIEELAKQPNVYLRGRISQKELYREWLSAGMWVYCTDFWETSCITCMEAQAMGAIPIYSPKWALAENVLHGIAIDGPADDPLTHARFAAEIVRMATQTHFQNNIRAKMMPEARERFNWERMVVQWELEADDVEVLPWPRDQFPFQL